jgi:hypothetical protein
LILKGLAPGSPISPGGFRLAYSFLNVIIGILLKNLSFWTRTCCGGLMWRITKFARAYMKYLLLLDKTGQNEYTVNTQEGLRETIEM